MEKRGARVLLVGTSHVAEESTHAITSAFEHLEPDVVAIELDRPRARALETGEKRRGSTLALFRHSGLFGTVFYLLARFLQERIGRSLGIEPGAEMLHAMRLARERKISIALIDQDIRITMARIKRIPLREKFRFIRDMLSGRMAGNRDLKELDLRKIPTDEIVLEVIAALRERYPAFYRALVEDRNEVMVRNIERLAQHYTRVLVVVGKGHMAGMQQILAKRGVPIAGDTP